LSQERVHTDVLTTEAAVAQVVAAARAGGRFGLDTEFLRERTYRARLCLVQIATADAVAVIDPLGEIDLSGVSELIADPEIEVVVHAGKQDLDIFYERDGLAPRRVYDVQLAAGFAGLGASLPYGRIVDAVMGVTLVKGESYTDWCRRPLTSEQIQYAADDVRYLLPVADQLENMLESLGRAGWVPEEMAHLEDPAAYGMRPEQAWRRVAGRGALSGKQAAVLRELAGWRERTASERDIPRGWLIKDVSLVELARRQPQSLAALKAIRGLNAKEAERSGRALLEAIQAGRNAPALDGRQPPPSRSIQTRARMTAGLADAVVRSRCERAGVATELVVTRAEMEALLSDIFSGRVDESRHRLLRGWRRELAGDYVLALARGEVAVRATDVPPYVEEVPINGRG
jgi:ribonuclease D